MNEREAGAAAKAGARVTRPYYGTEGYYHWHDDHFCYVQCLTGYHFVPYIHPARLDVADDWEIVESSEGAGDEQAS